MMIRNLGFKVQELEAGCTSGNPVYADASPHNAESCDVCGKAVLAA